MMQRREQEENMMLDEKSRQLDRDIEMRHRDIDRRQRDLERRERDLSQGPSLDADRGAERGRRTRWDTNKEQVCTFNPPPP